MKTWDDFFPYLMLDCPGAPSMALRSALFLAASEFCARTKAWQANLDRIRVLTGFDEYEVEPPDANSLVEGFVWIKRDNITPWYPDSHYTYLAPTLTLVSEPAEDFWLDIKAWLKPSPSATGIDDAIFNHWGEFIAAGASHRLLLVPGRAWSNPGLALERERNFKRGIGRAKNKLLRSSTVGSFEVNPQPFG